MTITFDDEGKPPTGEWAKARAYVEKHEGDNVVVDVYWFVKRMIFGARERLRTSEIAEAVGHPKAKVRRVLMGLNNMVDDEGARLMWVDLGHATDGHAASRQRAMGKRIGANDYRWEAT